MVETEVLRAEVPRFSAVSVPHGAKLPAVCGIPAVLCREMVAIQIVSLLFSLFFIARALNVSISVLFRVPRGS